jgi:hypothetical protein
MPCQYKIKSKLIGKGTRTMKIATLCLVILLTVTLTGCAWFKDNPYANFSVGDVNEKGPDTEATILVGDPQVISRETLINDRLREAAHIETLLNDSNNQQFKPQIARDLAVVNAFASELGVAFDPSLGAAFNREEGIAELTSEIELLKLRNQLNQLQQQIISDPTITDSNGLKPSEEKPTTVDNTNKPQLGTLTGDKGALTNIIATVNSLLTEAGTNVKKKVGGSALSSSPEERFEDLNAYRARLRQRQAEINLDDVHDSQGNTLYRLQFNTTVLPGEIKNKYGVLDLSIVASQASDEDIEQVYINWLLSLNTRNKEMGLYPEMNPVKKVWSNIVASLVSKKMIAQCYPNTGSENLFFLAPGEPELVEMKKVKGTVENLNQSIVQQAYFSGLVSSITLAPTEQSYFVPDSSIPLCQDFLDKYKPGSAPSEFIDALTEKKIDNQRYWKSDHVYTYQAQPSEKVQRLSTLASAANSMQSAFALAATLPQYGLAIDAGAAASRAAVGMADALERTPLVIGYTDKEESKSHFGYVFGPKAMLQADENQLVYKQIPASHSVFADISVPGWWPSLVLQTRSAWAGNWYNGAKILKSYNKTHEIKVRLRPKTQGFESITDFLFSSNVPSAATDIATIEEIRPTRISLCAQGRSVVFVIKGKNLWRNPNVFFLGEKQTKVEILPDMNGLLVQVDLEDLLISPTLFNNKDEFIIWTSFGKAKPIISDVEIINFVDSKEACTSISKISVSPDKSFYVAGNITDFKVNVTSKIPASIQGVEVIAQVLPDKKETRKIKIGQNTVSAGNGYQGTINLNADGLNTDKDTARLKVGLKYNLSADGKDHFAWASKKVVYYPKKERKKINLANQKVTSLPFNIALILPDRMKSAYPDFKLAEAEFKLALPNNTAFDKVTIPVDFHLATSGSLLTLGTPMGGDATQQGNFNTARCNADLTATLSLTSNNANAFPGINNPAITLVKKNCS